MHERRRHLRHPVSWPVRLWLRDSFCLVGHATDASAHGVRANFLNWIPSDVLKIGEAYLLEVSPEATDGFTCIVEIRRTSRHGIGMQFLSALRRILVVDDDSTLCELLLDYFADQAYFVTQARSADEALAAVRREHPDLVLLDIGLPGMNGLEVLRRIRRDHPRIGVVMMTGNEDPSLARACVRIGATDCLFKPLDFGRLRSTVTAGTRALAASTPQRPS